MIELESLSRKYDIARPVLYCGASDDQRESGLIAAWNGRFIFVQFDTRAWTDYPSMASFVCMGVYPEHLVFR